MLRLHVSWDRRKHSGQVDFDAGFTAPSAHLAILYLASAASGLTAALIAGRRLLWALELAILSDVGNIFILSVLLPTLTIKVKESKLSVTSTPENYNVSLVAPDVAWQCIVLLSAMTLDAAWNASLVYGASSSLALLHLVASLRSFVAIVGLWLPESAADSKSYNLVASLVGLHLTQMIGENLLRIDVVDHDEEDIDGLKDSLSGGELGRSKHDEEESDGMEVDNCNEIDETEVESSRTEDSNDIDHVQEIGDLNPLLTEDEMRGLRVVGEEETNKEEMDDRDAKNGTRADGSKVEDEDGQLDGWEWEHI